MMTKLEQMFESKISNYRSNKLELAARQALEALEEAYENGFLTGIAGLKTIDTITVMREALAEQADGEQWSPDDMAYRPSGLSIEQAEQEPMYISESCAERGCACHYSVEVDGEPIAVYSVPVRTKDLTDAFINELHKDAQDPITFARAVIAADREKNNVK